MISEPDVELLIFEPLNERQFTHCVDLLLL
jgi:hypothetical protein